MSFRDACIPVRLGWSSPFARWQGPLAEVSSLDLAVQVTADALASRGLPASEVSGIVLGWTVPQPEIFYGASTVAARIGAPHATGAMLSQACATSAACLQAAALRVEAGLDELSLVIATDRTSNGPVLTYPAPSAPGGAPRQEHWVLDSFRRDPWGGLSMVATAERVAAEAGLTRERLDEVTLLRYQQYQAALAADRAFQRNYMIPVTLRARRGEPAVIDRDVGVRPTSAEGLAKLAPAEAGGVVTYGTQTHPADGTAGLVVTTAARARELAAGEGIARILGTGVARVGRGEMPKAPVPAAMAALAEAGLGPADVDAVTTHNPFAVNDLWFSQQTGIPLDKMNAYGCSLIYGHPQGPTGARLIVELLHELRLRGGGIGLFTGCAAGDTGAAVIVRVED
jgi:acetyl-CoA acetyltransferase family protein